MQFQSVAVTAEAVGEDDVGAGLDKAAVIGRDTVGVLDVPGFGGIAGLQAHRKEVGAGGTVGRKPRATGEQALQEIAHTVRFREVVVKEKALPALKRKTALRSLASRRTGSAPAYPRARKSSVMARTGAASSGRSSETLRE